MATKKRTSAGDAARALVDEGGGERGVDVWRKPLGETLRLALGELQRRIALGTEAGGLTTLELIGLCNKLGAIDVEAGALLGDNED